MKKLQTVDGEVEEEEQVLSHKKLRKLRKKQKLMEEKPISASENKQKKKAVAGEGDKDTITRRNSVWVGNLSFRTTPDALRKFFADAGETTRVHMPTKAIHGTQIEGTKRGENRG